LTPPANPHRYWRSYLEAAKSNAAAAAFLHDYHSNPAEELDDLDSDPFEMNNLASKPEHVDKLVELRERIADRMSEVGDDRSLSGLPRLFYLLVLDAKSGKEVWRTQRAEKSNWATPFVWENEVRTEIVTPGTGTVQSYDLDGNLIWSLKGMSSITIATPFAAHGLLYVTSGYVGDWIMIGDHERPIYAIKPGAWGDITLAGDATSNEFIAWSRPQAAPYNPSTLVWGQRMFVLYDRGLLACYNARTGEEIFGRKRLPNGRAFTSSPWAVGDKIDCLNEDGVIYVIKDSDRLLMRTSTRVYCIKGPSGSRS